MIASWLDEMNIAAQPAITNQLGPDEKVLLSAEVTKINNRAKEQNRIFIITDKSIYHFEKRKLKKKIDLQKVSGMTTSNLSQEFVIHVSDDNDYRYIYPAKHFSKTKQPDVLCREKILKLLQETCFQNFSHKTIKITCKNSSMLSKFALRKEAKVKQQENHDDKENQDILLTASKNVSINSENQLSIQDFGLIQVLGKGTYGTVMLVKKKDSKEILALKCVNFEKSKFEYIATEKKILQQLNFPFLMQLKYHFFTPEKVYFAMPFLKSLIFLFISNNFIRGGDLSNYLKSERIFSEEKAKFYAAQVVLGLEYLHKHDIIYRDMKPENILMDENGYIYLSDFGVSKILKENKPTWSFCGTPEYMAPEVISKCGHGKEADWWGLGIFVYEMLFGKPPFNGQTDEQKYDVIMNSHVKFVEGIEVSPEVQDFILKCLQKDKKDRLGTKEGAKEAKQHSWLSNMDWESLLDKKIVPPFKPLLISETANRYYREHSIQERSINLNQL